MSDSGSEISSTASDSCISLFGLRIPKKLVPYMKIALVVVSAVLCWIAYQNDKGKNVYQSPQNSEEIVATNSINSETINKNPQE